MDIPVVYEDNFLLVVNKPSGILTIPAAGKKRKTLIEILNGGLKETRCGYRLYPCHRLDGPTSGLIIFAKGKSVQKAMMQMFKEKKIRKTYFAYVSGMLSNLKGIIRYPVDGKSAVTYYQVLRCVGDYSLLKINPVTGRKNQIRIHFKQIGNPIIGEDRFAFRRDFKIKSKKLCLVARELSFQHPVTKKNISLKIGLPEHFKKLAKT